MEKHYRFFVLFIPCVVVVVAFAVFNVFTHEKHLSIPNNNLEGMQKSLVMMFSTQNQIPTRYIATSLFASSVGKTEKGSLKESVSTPSDDNTKLEEFILDNESQATLDYSQGHHPLSGLEFILGFLSLLPFIVIPLMYVDYKRVSGQRDAEE